MHHLLRGVLPSVDYFSVIPSVVFSFCGVFKASSLAARALRCVFSSVFWRHLLQGVFLSVEFFSVIPCGVFSLACFSVIYCKVCFLLWSVESVILCGVFSLAYFPSVSFCGVFMCHPLRCELKYGFRPWLLLSNCQNHHRACQLKVRQVKVTFVVLTLVPRRKSQSRFKADWNQQSICCFLLSSNLSYQIVFNVTKYWVTLK